MKDGRHFENAFHLIGLLPNVKSPDLSNDKIIFQPSIHAQLFPIGRGCCE